MLITVEGIDGAGKTTILKRLEQLVKSDKFQKKIKDKGYSFIFEKEPNTKINTAAKVRKVLFDDKLPYDPISELLLFLVCRNELFKKKLNYLKEKDWLDYEPQNDKTICFLDRHLLSTMAYQGVNTGLGIDKIYDLSVMTTNNVKPDLIFYIDIDYQTSLKRLQETNKKLDKFEIRPVEEFEQIINMFHKSMKFINRDAKPNIVIINGNQILDKVLQDIMKELSKYDWWAIDTK